MEKTIINEDQIEKKSEIIKGLRNVYAENIEKQEEIYLKTLEDITSMIKHIRHCRYYFTHPDFNELSRRGPILGKDENDNILYIYDMDDNRVKGINMFNTKSEPERLMLRKYFEIHDFETAMKGLLSLISYQDRTIEELEKLNKKSEISIKKYE